MTDGQSASAAWYAEHSAIKSDRLRVEFNNDYYSIYSEADKMPGLLKDIAKSLLALNKRFQSKILKENQKRDEWDEWLHQESGQDTFKYGHDMSIEESDEKLVALQAVRNALVMMDKKLSLNPAMVEKLGQVVTGAQAFKATIEDLKKQKKNALAGFHAMRGPV